MLLHGVDRCEPSTNSGCSKGTLVSEEQECEEPLSSLETKPSDSYSVDVECYRRELKNP